MCYLIITKYLYSVYEFIYVLCGFITGKYIKHVYALYANNKNMAIRWKKKKTVVMCVSVFSKVKIKKMRMNRFHIDRKLTSILNSSRPQTNPRGRINETHCSLSCRVTRVLDKDCSWAETKKILVVIRRRTCCILRTITLWFDMVWYVQKPTTRRYRWGNKYRFWDDKGAKCLT